MAVARGRAGLFQMIEVQAEIVDRALPPSGRRRSVGARGARISVVLSAGDSCVGASAKFISSASTVGSSRGGISRVGDSSAPRSGVSRVKSRSEAGVQPRRFAGGGGVVVLVRDSMTQSAALAFRLAEQIDVDAVLAALEVEIDQRAGAAAAAGGARGEQRLIRGKSACP